MRPKSFKIFDTNFCKIQKYFLRNIFAGNYPKFSLCSKNLYFGSRFRGKRPSHPIKQQTDTSNDILRFFLSQNPIPVSKILEFSFKVISVIPCAWIQDLMRKMHSVVKFAKSSLFCPIRKRWKLQWMVRIYKMFQKLWRWHSNKSKKLHQSSAKWLWQNLLSSWTKHRNNSLQW